MQVLKKSFRGWKKWSWFEHEKELRIKSKYLLKAVNKVTAKTPEMLFWYLYWGLWTGTSSMGEGTAIKRENASNRKFRGQFYPANIYLFKVNNRNNRTRCEIYSIIVSMFMFLQCELWTLSAYYSSAFVVKFSCWLGR